MSGVVQASIDLAIEVEAARDFNLAMVANSVPLVRRLALTNRSAEPVRDLTVEVTLEPNFSTTWSAHISEITPGGTFGLEAVDLVFERGTLVNQVERSDANLAVRLRNASGEEIASQSTAVSVLAYNEWSANTVPQILAAFVMPNHPAIERILTAARERVAKLTGNPALDGYQSRSLARVKGIAQGIYETIQAFNVTYSNPPASFETTGQKVRTPEQVLEQQMGTCLDLSVLLAACLEQVGLHPLILVLKGHALPAVWLQEHELAEGATDDGVRLRKHADLEMLLVFDSSAVASRPLVPFSQAVRRGRAYLDEPEFRYAVDIRGARRQQFRPLPARVVGAYSTVEAAPAAVTASSSSGRVVATGPELPTGSGAAKAAKIPRIEKWKQRLLDTSLRNRLLNFRRDGKQVLRVMGKDLAGLEDALARGSALQLVPRPVAFGKTDPREKRLVDERVGDDALEPYLRDGLSKGALHLDVEPDALFARATEIFRSARESIEETGTNTLCLALGMLTWYESDSSELARSAPILLVPVTLKRDSRASQFSLVVSGEETRLNATLLEKLRSEYGITLPEVADQLPEDDAGIDVVAVFNAFRAAVINQRRWDVVSDAYLANVSFAKFLMWADLEQRSTSLLESPVVAHLVNGKGAAFPSSTAFTEPAELDRRYAPADLLCPLDADASQLAAVAAAGEGKSFVLQGPPGTGKSQSIANLIAHCLAQGKRVLFVAEKMAALEVVHRRLTRIGLAPFCLELYSNKNGKHHVLDQLQAALDVPPAAPPADWDTAQAHLRRDRDRLNAYAEALHRDRGGLTVFKALSRLTALRTAPRIELSPSCSAARAQVLATTAAAEALRVASAALPELSSVAWRGCELVAWDLGLPNRVRDAADRIQGHLDELVAGLADLSVRLEVALPRTIDQGDALGAIAVLLGEAPRTGDELLAVERWTEVEPNATALVRAGRARDEAVAALDLRYSDGIYTLDLATLSGRFDRYAGAFFLIAWWMLRSARRAMASVVKTPKQPPARQVAQDLKLAAAAREHGQTLDRLGDRGRAIFGPLWEPATRDWSAMERTVDWARRLQGSVSRLGQRVEAARVSRGSALDAAALRTGKAVQAHVAGLGAGLAELRTALGWSPGADAPPTDELDGLRTQLERWRAQLPLLREWFAYQEAARELRAIGAGSLAEAIDQGRIPPDQAGAAGERSALEQWLLREVAADPSLRAFHGDPHRATVDSFAAADRALLRGAEGMVGARLATRIPRGGGDVASSSELGILQRELKKKSRHMPLRKLFRQIPELAARLKPCFLMSPLSVAQYLEPGAAKFDVVVFDEASQIPTHDAIGALARGDSAVVVGDSKQLPPTSFFQQTDDGKDVDEDDFEELESILDECVAALLPERRLDWHYRSRHEDLIAFSNHRYYDNKLNTFPSAAARVAHLGVSLRQVDGVYDRAGARSNRVEAEAVVQELVTRLLDPVQSKRSIGIVTFSQAQQGLVEDMIDQRRKTQAALDPFFDDKLAEPVIVKNLENIQGDERDVMLFSICYGPDRAGKVAMNFGPLNRDGGERRLNVAVTRAREELVVFSTLRPEQIDLTKTNARGVRDLRLFLDYARRGPQAIAEALDVSGEARFDSPFEEEVHRKLTAKGWTVDTQVGCAGYRIDLGIRHPSQPGRYVLGVECDGAYYHSARSARERDRLRAEVLGTLGWKLHRIWSTDWWLDPDREVAKLEAAIKSALTATVVVTAAPQPAVRAPTDKAAPERFDDQPAPAARAYPVLVHQPATSPAAEVAPRLGRAAPPPASGPIPVPVASVDSRPYRVAIVPADRRAADDLHDPRHEAELRKLVADVVAAEAPLSVTLLAKRITPFYGSPRTSARVTARFQAMLDRRTKVIGEIVWRADQDPTTYQGFRRASTDVRPEVTDIAIEEIANAAAFALRANVAMPHEDLVKQTARALGFGRTGGRVAERMAEGIAQLVSRGHARRDGERIAVVDA